MQLILLGKLRSGKSTVTLMLKELFESEYGILLNQKPLASPIYEEAKALYERHGLVWRKNRRLLEGIGEALNEDYPKGDKIILLYDETFDPDEHIVVEDCRRTTQATYFKDKGAVFVRVIADREVRKSRCKEGEWAEGHSTDTELDDFPANFTINNNGNDLGQLRDIIYNEVVLRFKTQAC